jgi:hypothetical protein
MFSGERSFMERRAPWRGELCRKILQGEKSFVETLFWERTAPERENRRGENLSGERKSPWTESRRGEKVFVVNLSGERRAPWRTSPEREKRHGEPLRRECS